MFLGAIGMDDGERDRTKVSDASLSDTHHVTITDTFDQRLYKYIRPSKNKGTEKNH